MSLSSSTIKTGATAIAPTGGSDLVYTALKTGLDTVTAAVVADTDFRTRRTAEFTARAPKPQSSAPNGYTQVRNNVVLKFPRLLANGAISVDTVRIEVSSDVETSAANRLDMRYLAAQILGDTDYDSFWDSQSIA